MDIVGATRGSVPSVRAESQTGNSAEIAGSLERYLRWLRVFRDSSANRRVFIAMLTVAAAAGVVKLAVIAKEMVIAAQFGTGDQIDAFVIAYLLPSFLIGLVASAFHAAVIPTYVQVRDHDGPGAARQLISNVTLSSCALLVTLTVFLALAAPAILPLLVSGFGPEKLRLTQTLFFLLLPLVVLNGFTAIWGAALNAEERFILVSLTPGATPILIVLTLFAVGGALGFMRCLQR